MIPAKIRGVRFLLTSSRVLAPTAEPFSPIRTQNRLRDVDISSPGLPFFGIVLPPTFNTCLGTTSTIGIEFQSQSYSPFLLRTLLLYHDFNEPASQCFIEDFRLPHSLADPPRTSPIVIVNLRQDYRLLLIIWHITSIPPNGLDRPESVESSQG